MECGLALEASRVADVDDAPVGVEQRTGGRTHLLALEPGCRREMRVRAQEIAELGETDAARARERACVGARCGSARTRCASAANSAASESSPR
jgi:hypothetical protein